MLLTRSLDIDALLSFALGLGEFASTLLKKYFYEEYIFTQQIQSKKDGSPVTKVDRKVELALRERISQSFPEHAILGEEFGQTQASKDNGTGLQSAGFDSDFLWVIDPLDGTRSFITGNPLFGSLVGLLHEGQPILGVMDLPILGERYWGTSYKKNTRAGFICNRQATRPRSLHVRDCSHLKDATCRCTSPDMFKTVEKKAVFNKLQKEAKQMLYGGDCFCYGQLSKGLVDLVIESDLGCHDYLPLVPIIEGAGGLISDWSGKSLDLNSQGDVVAVGDTRLWQEVLGMIKD